MEFTACSTSHAFHRRPAIILVTWIYLTVSLLSKCLTTDQLSKFGFTPVEQTEIYNGTYCNRAWYGLSLCIASQEEFATTMNLAFNSTNSRQVSMINGIKSNFETMRRNMDQLFRNDTVGFYNSSSSLISPIDPNEFFTIFKKSYSNCFDNLNLIRLNWMCKLVTSNATNYLANNTIRALPKMAFLYQMSCVPVLRVYCMYLKYFEYISKTKNEYEQFSKVFAPAMIDACNNTLVLCDNNYSNGKCLESYKDLLVDYFFDLDGLRGEDEMTQLISYYFQNGSQPTFFGNGSFEFHTYNVAIDSEKGESVSWMSVKGILSQYSSTLRFNAVVYFLGIIILLN
jgi:hypothetical protein